MSKRFFADISGPLAGYFGPEPHITIKNLWVSNSLIAKSEIYLRFADRM